MGQLQHTQRLSHHHKDLRATITTSRRGGMASGGEQRAGEVQLDGVPPDTVQSLQHEIELIKAKIAQEREKIRDKTLQQVADIASISSPALTTRSWLAPETPPPL